MLVAGHCPCCKEKIIADVTVIAKENRNFMTRREMRLHTYENLRINYIEKYEAVIEDIVRIIKKNTEEVKSDDELKKSLKCAFSISMQCENEVVNDVKERLQVAVS